jgi:cytochrome c-type biogenesis protein CcmH
MMSKLLKFIATKRLELVLAIILVVGSIGLYLKLGRVDFIDTPRTNSHDFVIKENNHSANASDIASLLEPLKAKLEKNPDDVNGWALLARSYVEIGQHSSSFGSFENAIKLLPNDPQLLADYADAIVVVNGHQFTSKAEKLIEKALELDSNHEKALLLSATNAFKKTDYKQAVHQWEKLLKVIPFDAPLTSEVHDLIAEANQLADSASKTTPIKNIKKSVSDIAEISGVIKLATAFEEVVSENDTVFIFAKAVNGPPMPIAAIKVLASELPYIYHLNDTNSLNPEYKLSSAKDVLIVARVSKDGDAIPKSGDLQGMSPVIKVGEVLQDIEINQLID